MVSLPTHICVIGPQWVRNLSTNDKKIDRHTYHDDVIKWKHFPRNWPFVREIHRSPVNFPHKGHWRGALMFSLIYAWINDWVNNREAGDLRRQCGHYDVIVMIQRITLFMTWLLTIAIGLYIRFDDDIKVKYPYSHNQSPLETWAKRLRIAHVLHETHMKNGLNLRHTNGTIYLKSV